MARLFARISSLFLILLTFVTLFVPAVAADLPNMENVDSVCIINVEHNQIVLQKNANNCVRIPMRNSLRSLNLSNAVAIAVYEAFRQRDFEGLKEEGTPTTFSWE